METRQAYIIPVKGVFKRRIKYFSCEKYSELRKASLTGTPKGITFYRLIRDKCITVDITGL